MSSISNVTSYLCDVAFLEGYQFMTLTGVQGV